jgi:hypothetical protein
VLAASEPAEPEPRGSEAIARELRDDRRDLAKRGGRSQVLLNLQPAGLRIRASERDFIPLLGPIVSTPRSAKKLVNIYRLIRIGIPENELEEFVSGGPDEPYQTVLFLVAVLVGRPWCAPELFKAIRDSHPGQALPSLADELATTHKDDADWRAIQDGVHHLVDTTGGSFATDLGLYAEWVPPVARFSFHTREFLAEVIRQGADTMLSTSVTARATDSGTVPGE